MPVKIRLTRMGKKKQPSYRVVVMDSRKPRNGEYIEQIGFYDPRQDPSIIEIDNELALKWLRNGAQPTDRARKLLEISGAWTRFRIAKGDIHTVSDAPAPQPPAAPVAAEVPAAPVAAEVPAVAVAAEAPAPEVTAEAAVADSTEPRDAGEEE